jgi:hypothetical protein
MTRREALIAYGYHTGGCRVFLTEEYAAYEISIARAEMGLCSPVESFWKDRYAYLFDGHCTCGLREQLQDDPPVGSAGSLNKSVLITEPIVINTIS